MGARKYEPNNWRKGMQWSRVIGSLKRHLNAIENGEDYDGEKGVEADGKSGLLHAAHVAWNAITLLEYYKIYPQGDDREHTYLTRNKIGLDIDEVLCDFVGGWHKYWGTTPEPLFWYYDYSMNQKFKEMREKGDLNDFYLSLEPKIDPASIPFEPCCYVTSRPIPTEVTMEWLSKHGFPQVPVYTVGLGESKAALLKDVGVDIFVDDRFENFVELNKAGICTYLWDASHNKKYNVGYKRIKSLNEIA
jgi:5'(3')-deoxyribonucleotidase